MAVDEAAAAVLFNRFRLFSFSLLNRDSSELLLLLLLLLLGFLFVLLLLVSLVSMVVACSVFETCGCSSLLIFVVIELAVEAVMVEA